MTRRLTLVAVVVMLALGTSAALALDADPHATNDAAMAQETTTTTPEQTTTAAATANVTFGNQTSNGTAVVVQNVVVPEGGFVVIHAAENVTERTAENETEFEGVTQTQTTVAEVNATRTYAAGAVLGNSTYLEPGVHENVTVVLDQPLNESQFLIAMPHRDTNDNQQYGFPQADAPYTQDGQPVTDWAYVTVGQAANQTTAAGTETTTREM